MTEQAPENALERIDSALARIETAAARGATSATTLRRRHDRLRMRVGDAIAGLDSLIAAEDDA